MKQIFYFLLFLGLSLNAQDLTGHWVAVTASEGYYAELYLVKNQEGVYAGHSYDTEMGGYCRHWLDARYNEQTKEFVGLDMEAIAYSEGHAPTDYLYRYEKGENGKEYLVGTASLFPYEFRRGMSHVPSKGDLLNYRFSFRTTPNFVRLVKVSEDYKMYDSDMPLAMTPEQIMFEKSAFPEVFEEKEIVKLEQEKNLNKQPEGSFFDDAFQLPRVNIQTRKPISPKTEQTPEMPETESVPVKPLEQEEPEKNKPEEVQSIVSVKPTIEDKRKNRTDQLLTHIKLKARKITLLVRDYGTVDNDSITIFYNDKIIAKDLRITQKANEYTLELEPNKRNELVFVANNLGDTPPNTARITLIADDKRYHYKLFTDEENNALIVLENLLE